MLGFYRAAPQLCCFISGKLYNPYRPLCIMLKHAHPKITCINFKFQASLRPDCNGGLQLESEHQSRQSTRVLISGSRTWIVQESSSIFNVFGDASLSGELVYPRAIRTFHRKSRPEQDYVW